MIYFFKNCFIFYYTDINEKGFKVMLPNFNQMEKCTNGLKFYYAIDTIVFELSNLQTSTHTYVVKMVNMDSATLKTDFRQNFGT